MKTMCPHCYFEYAEADNTLAGKEVECANCNMKFIAEDLEKNKNKRIHAVKTPPQKIEKPLIARVSLLFGRVFVILGVLWLIFTLCAGFNGGSLDGVMTHLIACCVIIFAMGVPLQIAGTMINLLAEIAANTCKQ